MATTGDIVLEAQAAADQFDGPIAKLGEIQEPTLDEIQCLQRMLDKQADIMTEAAKNILDSPGLNEALARLQAATTNLKTVAQNMPNVTEVLKKANKFLGYGTDAVNAIKSVTGGAGAG